MISTILSIFGLGSSSGQPCGPDAIAQAYRELNHPDQGDSVVMGEPQLTDYSGHFDTDVKVEIPLTGSKYSNPAPLTFDLDGEELGWFLDNFGVSIDEIGQVEGKPVEVHWANGRPDPLWYVNSDDNNDGGE